MTQPTADEIAASSINQGRDGGLRPGDEHVDQDHPDVQTALAALMADDDD